MERSWRKYFLGTDTPMQTSKGRQERVYLNNAATPQVLKPVMEQLHRSLSNYAYDNEPNAISDLMRSEYNAVRETALAFVGADPALDTAVYAPSTTAAINLLAHVFHQLDPAQIVLTTRMEHMANYLPYRARMETALTALTVDGGIDLTDYQQKLERYQGRIKLVAITGAANITGIVPPVHKMAAMAHQYGARVFVDAVQLVQHVPFAMRPRGDPEHIDFVSFDGHKCYTGQSGGVLIGDRAFLSEFPPIMEGAGNTDFVTVKDIVYRPAPERFEAGYPDFLGILSLGNALDFLREVGLAEIRRYETRLYQYMLQRLQSIRGVTLYGTNQRVDHVPIVAFNVEGLSYRAVGRLLGYEFGIAVAAGTAGANLYVQELLGLTDAQARAQFESGAGYGIVRASIGLFNDFSDIDRLADALEAIAG